MSTEATDEHYASLRHRMVTEQLRSRGIADKHLLAVIDRIPRHLFVPPAQAPHAYDDRPLPIGQGQTISQPYMVARMSELLALRKTSRVLEIGTGSGYQTAILAEAAGRVWTVERSADLAESAAARLLALGYQNVEVILADGSLGHPDAAPYDAILVTAAAPRVPMSLRQQMATGGRMVIPIEAGPSFQRLLLVEKLNEAESPEAAYRETPILDCVFVPLVGEEGY